MYLLREELADRRPEHRVRVSRVVAGLLQNDLSLRPAPGFEQALAVHGWNHLVALGDQAQEWLLQRRRQRDRIEAVLEQQIYRQIPIVALGHRSQAVVGRCEAYARDEPLCCE